MQKTLMGYFCTTAQKRGWKAVKNGDLIELAGKEFDLFITCDQNIRYQQYLVQRSLATLEISTNDLRRILAFSEGINDAIRTIQPNEYVRLEIP